MDVHVCIQHCFCGSFFKSSENSLSRMWRAGAYPLFLIFVYRDGPELWMVLPCLFVSASDKISLELYLYRMSR